MIEKEVPELDEQGVKVVFLGRRWDLDPALAGKMVEAEARTEGNTRMTLFVAFNYGGRTEVLDAVRAAVEGGVDIAYLDEEDLSRYMYSQEMRDPDLVIRTSGERRLSNFLLWESAYSEFYFSNVLWPDYDKDEFERALRDYVGRERRFGQREAGDLRIRILVALVGVPLGVAAMVVGGYVFFGIVALLTLLGMHEFYTLIRPYKPNLLVGYLGAVSYTHLRAHETKA